MEFLDTPQKIATLRKKLKMKQYDFETENFTRGYLGLIESNRRKLTRNASDVIVKRFREKIKELGLDLEIDDDYFMRSPKEDAEMYCSKKLEDEDNITDDELIEIINICSLYNLSNLKAKAYLVRGVKSGKAQEHIKAYVYFIDALSSIDNNTPAELKGRLYYDLGANRFKVLDFNAAIEFFKKSLENYSNCDNSIVEVAKIFLNIGVCYKKLNNYEKAISTINESIIKYDFKSDLNTYVNRESIIAICYQELGKLDKAISIYNNLINYIKYHHNGEPKGLLRVEERLSKDEKIKLAYVYNNLADVLVLKEETSQAMDYYNESEKIRKEIQPEKLSHTLVEKSKLYFNCKMIEECINCAESALKISLQNNDYEYIIKSYDIMEKVFKLYNNNRKLEEIYLDEYSILIEIENYKDAIKVNNDLLNLYISEKNEKGVIKCKDNTSELLKFL